MGQTKTGKQQQNITTADSYIDEALYDLERISQSLHWYRQGVTGVYAVVENLRRIRGIERKLEHSLHLYAQNGALLPFLEVEK